MKKEKTKPSDHPVVVVVVIGTIPSKLNEVRSNLPIHVVAYDSAQQEKKRANIMCFPRPPSSSDGCVIIIMQLASLTIASSSAHHVVRGLHFGLLPCPGAFLFRNQLVQNVWPVYRGSRGG